MKLPIKQKYLDEIKAGKKSVEFRDAHITFVSEETNEELITDVIAVNISSQLSAPREAIRDGCISDEWVIAFVIKPRGAIC